MKYKYVLSRIGSDDRKFNSYDDIGNFLGKTKQHIWKYMNEQNQKINGWELIKIPMVAKKTKSKRAILLELLNLIEKKGSKEMKKLVEEYKKNGTVKYRYEEKKEND